MLITANFLRERRACSDQLELFETTYSDGVEATQENAQAALDAGLNVPWLFRFVPMTIVLCWPNGREEWYRDGKRHREDGPAVIRPDGYEAWYRNDQLHREDRPAVAWPDGMQAWYQDDKLHREDGPAVIWPDGREAWYRDGKLHRNDGPAIVWQSGHKGWWYQDGVRVPRPDS